MLELKNIVHSELDPTQKFLFLNDEKKALEVSYIDNGTGKDIICVPTQHGCSQGCLFCHLTDLGASRVGDVLNTDIVEAVQKVREELGLGTERPLLISYMGAGEPLCTQVEDLYESMKELSKIHPKIRFALSTTLPEGYEEEFIFLGKLVKEAGINLKIHLSLHFTQDIQRQKWLPKTGRIKPSLDLLEWYRDYTGNAVEIHYTLIDWINDRDQDIAELDLLLGRRSITLKLLEFNPKSGLNAKPSGKAEKFTKALSPNFVVEVYTPPGRDIGASCGQFDLDSYRNPLG